MMRKVRVVKYGQQPVMGKPGYSRGFNSGQFPVYYPGTEWVKPGTEVSKGLKPVPWDEANVEAEGGETAYVPDQGGMPAHFNINGPRHSEGGVPLNLPPDTFIYSDTRKMGLKGPILEYFGKDPKKTYTPAEIAKQYDINKYRKILQDPDTDHIQRHSAELMIQNYNRKLGALALAQEAKKGFPDGVPVAAIPFLMTYAIEPESVLPTMPEQQGMPMMQSPMPGAKKGGTTGTWAAPNYYQIGGGFIAAPDNTFVNPNFVRPEGFYDEMQGTPDYNEIVGNQLVTGLVDQAWGLGNSNIKNAEELYQKAYNRPMKDSDKRAILNREQRKHSVPLNWATGAGIPSNYSDYLDALSSNPKVYSKSRKQIGGTYSAQTEPEFGGNWMGKARAKKQYGGEEEQILQVIQMYAQVTGQDPDQIVSQLKQMPADQAQQALQQMAQNLQEMQSQSSEEEAMGSMYAYGGAYVPRAQAGLTVDIPESLPAFDAQKALKDIEMALTLEKDKEKKQYIQGVINDMLENIKATQQNIIRKRNMFSSPTAVDPAGRPLDLEGRKRILQELAKDEMLLQQQIATAKAYATPEAWSPAGFMRSTFGYDYEFNPKYVAPKPAAAPAPKATPAPAATPASQTPATSDFLTGEKRDSALKAMGFKYGGFLPKAQFGDARVVRGVNDETNYMLPVDPTTGLPVTNLPEFTVEAEGTPMAPGTGTSYNYPDMFAKAYREGRIATGRAEDMGASDPAALLAGAAFKLPKVAGWLMNALRKDPEYRKWAEEAGIPLPTAAKREGAREARKAASKTSKGKGASSKPTPASGNQKTPPGVINPKAGTGNPSKAWWNFLFPELEMDKTNTLHGMWMTEKVNEKIKADNQEYLKKKLERAKREATDTDKNGIPDYIDNEMKEAGMNVPADTLPAMPDTMPNPMSGRMVLGQDTFNVVAPNDSILNALGFKYGGNVPRAQAGLTVDPNKGLEVRANGEVFYIDPNTKTAVGPLNKDQIERIRNKNTASASASSTTATTKPATGTATAAASTTPSSGKGKGKGVKTYDYSKLPDDVKMILDKAGIVLDESVLQVGEIGPQSVDPATKEYKDIKSKIIADQKAWEKNNQWYLEDRKARGLAEFDPNNKTDVADFEESYNKKTYDDVYSEMVKRGITEDEAKKAAEYFVQNVGFIDDPNAINYKDKKHGNFHKTRVPVKFKEKEKPPVKQPTPTKPLETTPAQYVAQPGYAPWWMQDLVNIYGTAGDFLRQKKYLPWAPETEPVVPEPVFYDPTRELAANAEQMAIGTQGASAFGAPQQFNARFSEIQGAGAKNAADVLGRYNNLNVQTANTFEGQRAQIYNRNNELDARRAQDLYDKTTIANQQFDNSRAQARQNMRQAYIAGITNRAQAQAMNTMYPDYQVDPSTGGFVYYTPGARRMEAGDGSDSSFRTYYDQLKKDFPNISDEELFKEASKNYREKAGSSKTKRRTGSPTAGNPYGYPGAGGGYGQYAMTYPNGLPVAPMMYPYPYDETYG